MANFAQLDDKNIVIQVIVVDNNDVTDNNGDESESVGASFCQKHVNDFSTVWKQTSYNNNLRGNYAGIGMTYMSGVRTLGVASTDIFIGQQPFPSWSIGVGTAQWYAPIDRPVLTADEEAVNKFYTWNEDAYNADTNSPKTVGWVLT
tara:strand:+ start:1425 stop:1865 length:441 start_codon:yes stop_codon:yes gene_type:complete